MKKFIAVLTLSLVLAFSLVLTGCDLSGGKNNSGQNGISLDNLNSAKSVYGFSAASAGMIISSMNDEVPAADTSGTTDESGTTDTSGTTDESGTTDTSGGETNELDRYMGLVESLLNDDGFKIVTEESDRAEYTEKVTVSFTDIDGKESGYVMYYNQTMRDDGNRDRECDRDREEEFDSDDARDREEEFDYDDDRECDRDRDFEDDRDESEENYSIEGIMVIEGQDYEICGEREIETEYNESESKTEFRVNLGQSRYMTVEHKTETDGDETEFEYSCSITENGVTVEKSEFSVEEERNETEVEMKYYKDGAVKMFSFDKEMHNGKEVVCMTVRNGSEIKRYIVKSMPDENGNTSYEYGEIIK